MPIPTKTIAVRLFEYGGPDKLIYGEYDLPPVGPRDVLRAAWARRPCSSAGSPARG
jgi:hypothetical protein